MLVSLVVALALAAPGRPATGPPGPARVARAEADSIARGIEKDREETRQWLKSGATSYLATIRRVDFPSGGSLTVGRASDNAVALDDDAVQPHHLRVAVVGDSFHVEAVDDSARFRVGDVERREATLGPSAIRVARYTLRLSHQRYPAIIVFDPRSPRFQAYKGIDYYPVDLAWRYVLPLTPNPRVDTTVVVSTRGSQRRAVRIGWFDFKAAGGRCRLEGGRLLEPR